MRIFVSYLFYGFRCIRGSFFNRRKRFTAVVKFDKVVKQLFYLIRVFLCFYEQIHYPVNVRQLNWSCIWIIIEVFNTKV